MAFSNDEKQEIKDIVLETMTEQSDAVDYTEQVVEFAPGDEVPIVRNGDGTGEKSYGRAPVSMFGGGGSSGVNGIKVGGSGQVLTPTSGVVTLPAYESGAEKNPVKYLKEAAISQDGNSLTIKDNNNETKTFTPIGGGATIDTNQKVKTNNITFGDNDVVEIEAGSNVTVTGDSSAKKIIIAATNTTYESKVAASGGTDVSLVTTGEKYNWNNKQNSLTKTITNDGLGHIYDAASSVMTTADFFTQANTVYHIRYNHTLAADVTLPANCILSFEGGVLDGNATITGNDTHIDANSNDVIFGTGIVIAGTWDVTEIYDTWFAYTENMVSNQLITNMLNMTTEDYQNKVLVTRDTTYYVEFTPPEEWCVEHPLWKTDGWLRDKSSQDYVPLYVDGHPVYGDGSQTSDDLYWYQDQNMPTTRSIANHLGNFYYSDPNNIYLQYHPTYGGIIWDPAVINRITLFFIKSNTHLVINSTIQMLDHKQTAYNMFHMMNKHNITIEGTGVIHGEITDNYDITNKWPISSFSKADMYDGLWHLYYGEFGVLVNMLGASDVVIRDITLSGSSGDCLYINPNIMECPNGDGIPNPPSITKNVLVENVKIDKARRNGIVCCGVNITLNDILFSNCGIDGIGGTAPKSGIDFENDVVHPMLVKGSGGQLLLKVKEIMDTYYSDNYNAMGCINVRMNNCKFENNVNDISATSTQVDQSEINEGDPSNLTPGAAIISNCNISRLRLNWTNCIRFKNCQIDTITSYDGTGSPEHISKYVEYENCRFGENVASSYFGYAKNNYSLGYQKVRFDWCTGRTMFYGKDYVYYKNLADGIINIRIPFNYDSRLETDKYKIHKGIVHVRVVNYTSENSLRISECDVLLSNYPNMVNAKYYGGGDNVLANNWPYVSVCSKPQTITIGDKKYISFYIAGGDVLDRYYDYTTKQFSSTPSGARIYDNKDVLVSFDYMGVPDERGNKTVSVQNGAEEEQLEGGVYSGISILCDDNGPGSWATVASGYDFNKNYWSNTNIGTRTIYYNEEYNKELVWTGDVSLGQNGWVDTMGNHPNLMVTLSMNANNLRNSGFRIDSSNKIVNDVSTSQQYGAMIDVRQYQGQTIFIRRNDTNQFSFAFLKNETIENNTDVQWPQEWYAVYTGDTVFWPVPIDATYLYILMNSSGIDRRPKKIEIGYKIKT